MSLGLVSTVAAAMGLIAAFALALAAGRSRAARWQGVVGVLGALGSVGVVAVALAVDPAAWLGSRGGVVLGMAGGAAYGAWLGWPRSQSRGDALAASLLLALGAAACAAAPGVDASRGGALASVVWALASGSVFVGAARALSWRAAAPAGGVAVAAALLSAAAALGALAAVSPWHALPLLAVDCATRAPARLGVVLSDATSGAVVVRDLPVRLPLGSVANLLATAWQAAAVAGLVALVARWAPWRGVLAAVRYATWALAAAWLGGLAALVAALHRRVGPLDVDAWLRGLDRTVLGATDLHAVATRGGSELGALCLDGGLSGGPLLAGYWLATAWVLVAALVVGRGVTATTPFEASPSTPAPRAMLPGALAGLAAWVVVARDELYTGLGPVTGGDSLVFVGVAVLALGAWWARVQAPRRGDFAWMLGMAAAVLAVLGLGVV